jgi:alcohol/geraniol dehydrogenase (NADP+)
MSIRAYAAHGCGQALESFSYDPLPLGPRDVEIAVTHCGICHSDIHMIDNDWKISRYPLVPGHEVVGTVSALGVDVKHLTKGQRVGLGWQSGSCGTCEWCIRGDDTCCPKEEGTIVGRHGGFASAVRADARFAIPIPDGLASETVGPLLCGGVTVYTPLVANVRSASRVGVIGIGGLGHMALRFARALGCEVTAFSTSQDKRAEAKTFGAHNFVVSTDAEQLRRATASIDVLVSAVTADLDWDTWLKILRPRGTLVVVGASPGRLNVPVNSLISSHKSIRGSAIGNRATLVEMLDFAARHGIAAQTEVVPMAEVNAAIEKVRANRARYRMVLKN